MKAFVATGTGNRRLLCDLGRAVDGELVCLERNDGPCAECGCLWSVTGVASGKVAHSFSVADRPDLDASEFAQLLGNAWRRRGWPVTDRNRATLTAWAQLQLDVADTFDIGERLRFRRGVLHRAGVAELA